MDTITRGLPDEADLISREVLAISRTDAGLSLDIELLCAHAVPIANGLRRVGPRLLRSRLLEALSVDPADVYGAVAALEETLDPLPSESGPDEGGSDDGRPSKWTVRRYLLAALASSLLVCAAVEYDAPGSINAWTAAIASRASSVAAAPSVEQATAMLSRSIEAGLPNELATPKSPAVTSIEEPRVRLHSARLRQWMEMQAIEIVTLGKCPKTQEWTGAYDLKRRRVTLCPRLGAANELHVTIHEIGHVLQHRDRLPMDEAQAQAVTYVVLTALGVDATGAADVMRDQKKYRPTAAKVSEQRDTIERIATEIVDAARGHS